ncbi:hypothetical protein AALP_AA8G167100 [Arabis alpina]|uniref:Uncharacterized protein n=1 Tax=Arabis alpina TaxID=50452 RepID=A0A087G7H6_ARAAL|nr:hypothetical protein AALP_AA8G167100 [Arabis alpina]
MTDNKQSFQAGQATGKTEEKGNVVIEKVKDAATGTGTATQQSGQNISEAAGGAVNVVKDKTGMNK